MEGPRDEDRLFPPLGWRDDWQKRRVEIWLPPDKGNKESHLNKELTIQTQLSSQSVWQWDAWKGNMHTHTQTGKSTGKQIKHPLLEHPLLLLGYCFFFSRQASDPPLHSTFIYSFLLILFFMLCAFISDVKAKKSEDCKKGSFHM